MLTVLLLVGGVAVAFKILGFALKVAFNITGFVFSLLLIPVLLVLSPFFIFGAIGAGLLYLAIPILLVLFIAAIIKAATT